MKTIHFSNSLRVPFRQFAQFRFLVFLLCALCVLCGELTAQQWRSVANGVEYAEMRREISGKFVDINLLRLDLRKARLDVHHANDSAIGTETTSSIAKRKRAFAAINAGFFRLDRSLFAGDPVGLFMVDGKPLSEPTNERIQMIVNNGTAKTDVLFARTKLTQSVRIGTDTLAITGINRERAAEDLVIYTPEFGSTTNSSPAGTELVVVKGVITAVLNDIGNAAIPKNGFVISASGNIRDRLRELGRTQAGAILRQEWEGLPTEFHKDRGKLDVVTGVPQLVRNGNIDISWEQERSSKSFVETRHPRTAVAKLKDGKFLLLTADGRTEASAGIDLNDLAKLMLELGATDAINLDGGGSTTMYLDRKVVNKPSDPTGERKVSDTILVTLRRRR